MRYRHIALLSVLIAVLSVNFAPRAQATSLKVTPLEYRTSLKADEKQKGFVDISNPSAESVNLVFEVRSFRQIDDQAHIEFYDDARIAEGVLLDVASTDLGPRETLRLYFLIDGAKLPSGEIFAAILARTVPNSTPGTTQSIRVGTILEIVHGEPKSHTASITDFSAPFFQLGDTLSATFVVHNDDSSNSTGFRPQIKVDVSPYTVRDVEGPLVFAGRSREVAYRVDGSYLGFVWLQAGVAGASQGRLIFAMTGYWRWLGPLMVVALGSLIAMTLYTRRKKR